MNENKTVDPTPPEPLNQPKEKTPSYKDLVNSPEMKGLPLLYRKTVPLFAVVLTVFAKMSHKFIAPLFQSTVDWWSNWYNTKYKTQWEDIDQRLRVRMGVQQTTMDELKETYEWNAWAGTILGLIIYFVSIIARLTGILSSTRANAVQQMNKETQLNLASPENVILSNIRGSTDTTTTVDMLKRLGLHADTVKVYKSVLKQYTGIEPVLMAVLKGNMSGEEGDTILDNMNVDTLSRKAVLGALKQIAPDEVLIQNYYRDEINKTELVTELSKKGYDTDQQQYYINILDRIPPIQDIITMGVREAFSPEKVKEFQYDEDFPKQFGVWAEKQGFSKDWAKRYWYAHWNLPSPQMVFEMLHRGVINAEVLDRFLIVADYPKFWRDKMKEISYRPLARVDVRRMYQLGTFDRVEGMTPEQAIEKAYKDIGFNEHNAKLMVQFTIDFYGEERKKLTESKVIKLFKQGLLSESEVKPLLKELNYRDGYVEYLIESANYDVESSLLDALLKKLRSLYINGEYTKNDVLSELAIETIIPVDTTQLFKEWNFTRDTRRRLPQARDVKVWVEKMIISPSKGVKKLIQLGYSEEDAVAYVWEITGSKPKGSFK